METKVIHIKDIKDINKKDLFSVLTHDGLLLFPKLRYALTSFYATPSRKGMHAPKSWNPTIKYDFVSLDPCMLGFDEEVEKESDFFKKRSGAAAMQATIEVFDYIKNKMNSTRCQHTIRPIESAQHYIITKEQVTKNSVIIGFFYLKDNFYERFLIKDLKAFCEAISPTVNSFSKILKEWAPREMQGTAEMNIKEMTDMVRPLVEDARTLPIDDIYIQEMIKYFIESERKVISASF
jgi:hypothetical protein